MDAASDAEVAYVAAQERLAYVVGLWEAEGSPVVTEGSQGQQVPHPLWKAILEAEALSDKLRTRLRVKKMGRPQVAVLEASVGTSPAARLRSVK